MIKINKENESLDPGKKRGFFSNGFSTKNNLNNN